MLPDLNRWLAWFSCNQCDDTDWTLPARLTPEEAATIGKSLAAFQLGEHSEGRSLMKFARAYAAEHGDNQLTEITRLFIAEEQRHARVLGRFMDECGLPRITQNWTDNVFRGLRRHVGYELSITVLITAEIIALTYYRALAAATDCALLRQICARILRDERAHVTFESSLIRHIRREHSAPRRWLTAAGHRLLFFGAVLVVCADHRGVIRRGGYSAGEFTRACRQDFESCFPS